MDVEKTSGNLVGIAIETVWQRRRNQILMGYPGSHWLAEICKKSGKMLNFSQGRWFTRLWYSLQCLRVRKKIVASEWWCKIYELEWERNLSFEYDVAGDVQRVDFEGMLLWDQRRANTQPSEQECIIFKELLGGWRWRRSFAVANK